MRSTLLIISIRDIERRFYTRTHSRILPRTHARTQARAARTLTHKHRRMQCHAQTHTHTRASSNTLANTQAKGDKPTAPKFSFPTSHRSKVIDNRVPGPASYGQEISPYAYPSAPAIGLHFRTKYEPKHVSG